MARTHTAAERFKVMVLWWAGASEADICRRSLLRSKAVFRNIRNGESKGMKPRSQMTDEERQAVLDGMRAAIPEGVVMSPKDFVAVPLDERRQRRTRRQDYGGRREVVFYGSDGSETVAREKTHRREPGVALTHETARRMAPIAEATDHLADVRGVAPGRDGEAFTEEVFSAPYGEARKTRNADVNQVASLASRRLLHDPQKRDSTDIDVRSSRWAGARRETMAEEIARLMEAAGRGDGLSSIEYGKAGGGSLQSTDPKVAAFVAMGDLGEIRDRMPPRCWSAIERLLTPGGLPVLGTTRKRRLRPEEARARKAMLELIWLALDYAATWPRAGRDPKSGRRFALMTVGEFRKRWPDAVLPEDVPGTAVATAELRAAMARAVAEHA